MKSVTKAVKFEWKDGDGRNCEDSADGHLVENEFESGSLYGEYV